MLGTISELGAELARREWILRSGGSPGADIAFELGCDRAGGRKEIFLPWPGFNGSDSPLFEIPAAALEIAKRIHPHLNRRNWKVRKLRARNVCQILGASLDSPADVVLAWTAGGEVSGGSATVLHIAEERGIPVINLGQPKYADADYRYLLAPILDAGVRRTTR